MGERRHRAKKFLGQNFLVDGNLQRKIVDAVAAGPGDELLEIGPGQGALTRHLAGTVDHLVLVELDRDLAAELRDRYGDDPAVDVVEGDILETKLPPLFRDWSRTHVVGNIPYNITTPILFHLLERPRPLEILLMVQREVADRITAEAGTGAYGALAVGVQSVADAELLFTVPRKAFRPVPKVESAVVRIRPHAPPRLSVEEEGRLRTLTRAAFQWRRKQMQKILRSHPDLSVDRDVVDRMGQDRDLRRRPETFSPGALLEMSRALP